jgi:phage tail sheath gpL-like
MLSYLGTAGGQGTFGSPNVPGVGAAIVAFANGSIDPTIATALANLPSTTYDFIYCPYNDTTSLNAMQAFLGDAAGRWNWSEELFGHAFTAKGGTLSTRTTWSTARNDQHMTAIGASGSPTPDWGWAVDMTAVHAVSIRADPSLPVGGLGGGYALNVLAPLPINRDTFSAEQTLLSDGMSTYTVDAAGVVRVHRSITTYQFNAGGAPDNSYLDTEVPFQLMAYIRAVRSLIQSQFNQVKLVADGSRIPVGSAMVTAQTILMSVVALYRVQANQGLVQSPDTFAANAVAQNAGSGVVKMLLPVALANQLYVVALDVQFTKP